MRLDGAWRDGVLGMGEPDPQPDVTGAGDDSTVLLFALGRVPFDDPRLTITGDRDLAGELKRNVPGP